MVCSTYSHPVRATVVIAMKETIKIKAMDFFKVFMLITPFIFSFCWEGFPGGSPSLVFFLVILFPQTQSSALSTYRHRLVLMDAVPEAVMDLLEPAAVTVVRAVDPEAAQLSVVEQDVPLAAVTLPSGS
jgi:hypothetical protein